MIKLMKYGRSLAILAIVAVVIGIFMLGNFSMTGDSIMSGKEIIVIETSKGNIEVELNRDKAPLSVENFLKYVSGGKYDGTVFHRVISGFMIQCGGFLPDGKKVETYEPIKLESKNGLSNNKYTLAMARTNERDSATNQFFINTENNDFLNYAADRDGYAVFGNVISGTEVVDEIGKVRTTTKFGYYRDWPAEDVVINKVYLKD